MAAPLRLAEPGEERDETLESVVRPPACWLVPVVMFSIDLIALLTAVGIAGGTPVGLAYASVALTAVGRVAGVSRRRITLRALDETPWLVARFVIALGAADADRAARRRNRCACARLVPLGVGFVVMGRVMWFAALWCLRRGGVLLEPTVILGGGQIGAEIARVPCEDRTYGAAPIGFVDSVSGNLPLPVLGEIDELDRIIDRYDVRRMIVAFGPARVM